MSGDLRALVAALAPHLPPAECDRAVAAAREEVEAARRLRDWLAAQQDRDAR